MPKKMNSAVRKQIICIRIIQFSASFGVHFPALALVRNLTHSHTTTKTMTHSNTYPSIFLNPKKQTTVQSIEYTLQQY